MPLLCARSMTDSPSLKLARPSEAKRTCRRVPTDHFLQSRGDLQQQTITIISNARPRHATSNSSRAGSFPADSMPGLEFS